MVETVVATIPYQGYDETQSYFGEGEYEIFIDNVDAVLDNPIIVLDGFDPGDARDITGLYNSLEFNGQNMADILRDQGYDIVILNAPQYNTGGKDIDGGADYIQRNAFVLAELISIINTQKVGDEELVILGPSMGGLIGRYALAYMEQNSLPHDTRLYISFDSPHRGANVSISLQYLINYLAFEFDNQQAQDIVSVVLNSPAAKEMLVDHLAAHLANGSDTDQDPTKLVPEGAPDFRDAFQAELDALGFPQNVRNVAMINGSGIGTTTGSPGMQVINTTLDIIAGTTAEVSLHFMPEASQVINITDWETFLGPISIGTFSADGESLATSAGVDSAPGGTANISAALGDAGSNPIIQQFIDALDQDEYCFIPTLSALAINEDDWYVNPDLSASPFVNTHIPDENEDHVTVTQQGAAFAIFEITGTVLGTNEVSGSSNYILANNPVGELLRLSIAPNKVSGQLQLSVYSMNGQRVYETTMDGISEQIEVVHGLSSGLYILTLTDSEGVYSYKLVVE
ncbi:MAG: hypothetical protein Aureis2KO_15230 [Aureisphaera sp.]